MAKSVSKIGTREQRKKLKPSGKPYFESLEKGLDFGYRKGQRGGSWVIRRYLGDRKYAVETIGTVDDDADADGAKVLTYHQAREKARERVQALAEEARIASLGPPVTVRSVVKAYTDARTARETHNRGRDGFEKVNGVRRDAHSRLTKHVLVDDKLAAIPLAALAADDLAHWRKGLKGLKAPQRVVNDFKAALNSGVRSVKAPEVRQAIRDAIKEGLAKVEAAPAAAREAQILPDADVRRIVSAAWEVDREGGWYGDLARIVLVLAATGARFSQVIRMTVADVQPEQGRLMVPTSRKGRGVKQKTHIAVRVGGDVIAALAKATAGRQGSDPLFLRPHWRQIAPAKWEKSERGPWFAAAELTRPWGAIVARAGLAAGTVPYALRHSSIVRGLRASLPVRLVAALHDTSSAMIEGHYSAYVIDAMDELAARAIVPLTTAPTSVVELSKARG